MKLTRTRFKPRGGPEKLPPRHSVDLVTVPRTHYRCLRDS